MKNFFRKSGVFDSDSSGYSSDQNGRKSKRDSKIEIEVEENFEENLEKNLVKNEKKIEEEFDDLSWSDLKVDVSLVSYIYYLPLRFRKAGSVWCGGARETH